MSKSIKQLAILLADRDFKKNWKRVGLDNMRALSRTVITGSIDVSSADSTIPDTLKAKLIAQDFDEKTVPPLCLENYEKISLSAEEISLLKKNEKMACLNVASLITKTQKEIVEVINKNYNEAMDLLFEVASYLTDQDSVDNNIKINAEEVEGLLAFIARIMGEGIVEGDWLRSHPSTKFEVYTHPENLKKQLKDFALQFSKKFNQLVAIDAPEERKAAAIELAAWVEYRVNLTDHFLADGCGKTSAILANFVYIMAGVSPNDAPTLDRKKYFNFDVVPTTNLVIKKHHSTDSIKERRHTSSERQELEIRIRGEWIRWLRHYKASFFAKDCRTITCADAWSVPSATLGQHLQTFHPLNATEDNTYVIPEDANFTNLHYALRSDDEIAELASAIGSTDIQKMLTFPMTRLSLFHTIVYCETELKSESDDDMVRIVRNVYQTFTGRVSIDNKKFNAYLKDKQKEFLLAASEGAQFAKIGAGKYADLHEEIRTAIQQRIDRKEYIPSDTALQMIQPFNTIATDFATKIINDKIYQDLSTDFFSGEFEWHISQVVKALHCQQLEIPEPTERYSFMVAGAPACGKGSAVATVAKMAEDQLGIEWDNTVKINTDTHRLIVSHPNITGDRTEFAGTLNNHDAGMLTDMAYARLEKKIADGRGPHMFIDGVNISQERVELSTANHGRLLLSVVTLSPELSIERAFKRGQGDGRFVPTAYNISKHRSVSKNFFKELGAMISRGQSNIQVILLDTDVPKGEPLNRIMTADLKGKKVTIYDKKRLSEFLGRANLDITATKAYELYLHEKDKTDDSFIEQLDMMGFKKITCTEDLAERASSSLFFKTPKSEKKFDAALNHKTPTSTGTIKQ